MRKILLKTSLVFLIPPMLTGCMVSKDQFNSLSLKVRNQDNRLVELEQVTDDGSTATGTVQKRQADLSLELDRLSADLLQIKGQLDETNHRNQSLQDENLQLRAMLESRLEELEVNSQNLQQKVVGLDTNLSSVQSAMEEEAKRRAEDALRNAEEARQRAEAAMQAKRQADESKRRAASAAAAQAAAISANKETTGIHELKPRESKKKIAKATSKSSTVSQAKAPVSSTQLTTSTEAESIYDKALGQYRSNEYKKAITTFSTFLDKYPKDKLAPNARYWLGASMLNSGDYSGAVLEFQNIVDGYPNHAKAPEALLQQAKAFEHFGEKAVQIKLYKDVLAYYPDSEQAKKAKKMLQKLQ